MPFPELVEKNKQQILKIATIHGTRNVRVFGSFARGEAGPKAIWICWLKWPPNILLFFPAVLLPIWKSYCIGMWMWLPKRGFIPSFGKKY